MKERDKTRRLFHPDSWFARGTKGARNSDDVTIPRIAIHSIKTVFICRRLGDCDDPAGAARTRLAATVRPRSGAGALQHGTR
jgi:hypothetical protein